MASRALDTARDIVISPLPKNLPQNKLVKNIFKILQSWFSDEQIKKVFKEINEKKKGK